MPESAALLVEDLKFRYAPANTNGAGEVSGWVVDIPRLAVGAGEHLLLTGGSGRGKSTLLYLIAGLMEPASGRVVVAGQHVHALRGAARDLFRGRHIGMIFQTFNLLTGFSAVENVMAAMMFSQIPRREHRPRAAALLNRMGIHGVEQQTDRMSVGQQQRVAVARAVACDPVLVLADEPTASLDPENSDAAMDLIEEACREKGAALLCVSHDPGLAERFARRESLVDLSGKALVK